MLLQDPDDLLFRVPALLHRPSSRLDYEKTPVGPGRDFRGQVTWKIFETGKAPANSPQTTTNPPQIHHQKTTFCHPFFQKPPAKTRKTTQRKIPQINRSRPITGWRSVRLRR